MFKRYPYVGPKKLKIAAHLPIPRYQISSPQQVLQWIKETEQEETFGKQFVATFIIDLAGFLWITDRHAEHITCAKGKAVLSAGEMTFAIHSNQVEVVFVTNQSTGYCPEPASWPLVAKALELSKIECPATFSLEIEFRFCSQCQTKNIIKENFFECANCGATLDQHWNFSKEPDSLC